MTGANAKIKRIYVGDKQVRPSEWKPSNPYCWYKFNGDYTDATGSFGVATGTSTFATLTSGQKVLQTDGTNFVLLPSGVTNTAIREYTIAFWMKTLTTSPDACYYAGSGTAGSGSLSNKPGMSFYESTSGRCFYDWANASTSWNNIDTTISGLGTGWRLVILRSDGNYRANVKMRINKSSNITATGTSGPNDSQIFGWNQFAIGARNPNPDTSLERQKCSIQMSNFVISHSCWSDTECDEMYDGTKSLYGL